MKPATMTAETSAWVNLLAQSYIPSNIFRIMEFLDGTEHSLAEIAAHLELDTETTRKWVVRLHKHFKVIYITHWKQQKVGGPIPHYLVGTEKSARKPAKLTAAQKCKNYRAKKAVITGQVKLGLFGV